MNESRSALIVFAKVPEPNKVKTRLTTLLTPEWAARLYEGFLLDALDSYVCLPFDIRLYFSSSLDEIPSHFKREAITLHEQKGKGLGERMATAFVDTFIAGYKKAVIIGTDHPTLPTSFVEQAFLSLSEPYSTAIGPSDDGGYYLLGMNEFYSVLFKDMTYSHSQVFAQTLERIEQTNATMHILPAWYDVDTPASLKRLVEDVKDSSFSLVRTRELLKKNSTTISCTY